MSQSLSLTRNSIRATTDRGFPVGGLTVAILLHAAIVAATLFSWRHTLDIADRSPPLVTVDVVNVAEKTNVAPTVAHVTPPTPTPAPVPPTVTPEPAPLPTPPVTAKPEPLPTPVAKPTVPPPQVKTPKKESVEDVLNMALSGGVKSPPDARPSVHTNQGAGSGMDISLAALLQSSIYHCWYPDRGAPHADDFVFNLEIFLNRNGTISQTPQLTAQSARVAATSSYARAAADRVINAVRACAPYSKLPQDKYNEWHDFTIAFDPSKLDQ